MHYIYAIYNMLLTWNVAKFKIFRIKPGKNGK